MALKLGVSYYGNRIPWRVKEDLQEIRKAGCNYVVHTFSEEDFEFYQGAMAEIAAESHRLGLEVWLDPWAIGQVFGGETFSQLVAKDLTLRQIGSEGDSLPVACPNHPAFREYLLRWIGASKAIGADFLFWDEPHFFLYPEAAGSMPPKIWACRCRYCQESFAKRMGGAMPLVFDESVRAFKEDSLVEFTRFLCDATVAQGMKAAVCLLPFESTSTVNDWAKVAAIRSLSVFGTDPYWKPHEKDVEGYVGRFAKQVQGLCKQFGKEPQLWILNFNIPKGEEGKIREAIEAGWREGIRSFAAWSYYGASYIKLKAEDPQAVWKTLSTVYQELLRRP